MKNLEKLISKPMIKKFINEYKLILIVSFIFIIIFAIAGVMRHLTFRTHGFDFSFYDQLLWNTYHGKFLYSSVIIEKGSSMFQLHFRPIFLFLIPPYFLFPNPVTLQIIHAFILGIAIVPLYLIAKEKLNSKRVAIVLALTFCFFTYVLRIWKYDFHPEVFYPVFIFLIFYFFMKKKFVLYFLFLFLTFMVKEDAFLYGIGLGIYAIIKKENKVAIFTIILAVIYGFFALKVIPPYFDGGPMYASGYYSHLGNSSIEVIKNFFLKPQIVIETLFTWVRIKSFFNLFSKVLFLPFLDFSTLLLILPPLFELFLSKSDIMYGLGVYYSAPVIPFLFISVIFGLKKIENIIKTRKLSVDSEKTIFRIVVFIFIMNFILSRPWLILAPKNFKITEHHITGYQILKLIPSDASVCAQIDLYPHVVYRDKIYLFPKFNQENVEYILLDIESNKWPLSDEEYTQIVKELLKNKNFETIFSKDGWYLLKRTIK